MCLSLIKSKQSDQTVERFGRLDTWVHTAGTDVFATFDRISPEEFKRVIDVNLMGQYGAMAALSLPQTNPAGIINSHYLNGSA